MCETNLDSILTFSIEQKSEFPIKDFNCSLLNLIANKRSILLKSFAFLTDILNNPEEIISGDIGNMMINASLFVG